MYAIKTRKGKANLYKTDKNTYAVNLPLDVSRTIFNKQRKRIYLYLNADSRENTTKALQHVEKIQELLDAQNWSELLTYEESLNKKVIRGEFTQKTLQSLWDDYKIAKQDGWEISYIQGDIKETIDILNSMPDVYLDSGLDEVINHLMEITTFKQVKRYLKQISACLTWGKKRRIVHDNPLPNFIATLSTKKRNSEEVDICPFTITERDLIIEAFRTGKFERYSGTHTQYADYIEFLFLSGTRTSEALGLRWEHIDFDKKIIRLQEARVLAASGKSRGNIQKKGLKTQKQRILPMSQRLYELLVARKECCADLSQNVFENVAHHSFRSSAYRTVLKQLGIAYRKPYQTRHTFITIMANYSELKLHQVAKICGTTTKIIEEHYLATNVDIWQLPNI
jgi:integrase